MKYIVMECHPGYAVLLAGDGSIVRAANLGYEVGQTVEAPVLTDGKFLKHHALVRAARSVAALAACFILLLGLNFYRNRLTVYSSILISINPSVRIDLNRRGDVVGIVGEDADGERLLEGYEFRGKEKTVVAGELIGRAVDMGFLADGGSVEFSIDTPSESAYKEYDTQLSSLLSSAAGKTDTQLDSLLPSSIKAPVSFNYEISNFRSGASHTGAWDDDDDDDGDDLYDDDDDDDDDDENDRDDEDDENDRDDEDDEDDEDGDD